MLARPCLSEHALGPLEETLCSISRGLFRSHSSRTTLGSDSAAAKASGMKLNSSKAGPHRPGGTTQSRAVSHGVLRTRPAYLPEVWAVSWCCFLLLSCWVGGTLRLEMKRQMGLQQKCTLHRPRGARSTRTPFCSFYREEHSHVPYSKAGPSKLSLMGNDL